MRKNRHIGFFGAALAVALLSSCGKNPESTGRNYMPDMAYAVSYETYAENHLFPDSQNARKPVAGTIPYGWLPANDSMDEGSLQSYLYKRYYSDDTIGYKKAAELKNPIELNDETLAQGKKVYDVFCVVCHGGAGEGQGPVVINSNFPPPPAYAKIMNPAGRGPLTEGEMFHSITYGKNAMGSYSSQVTPEDRWKVIYYIQKLSGTGRFAVAATDPVSTATTDTIGKTQ